MGTEHELAHEFDVTTAKLAEELSRPIELPGPALDADLVEGCQIVRAHRLILRVASQLRDERATAASQGTATLFTTPRVVS